MIYPTVYRKRQHAARADFDRINQAISQFFSDAPHRCDTYPPINISADEERAVLTAELPGFNVEDVKITVKSNYITLEGKREQPEYAGDTTAHRSERGYGSFIRSASLPYEVQSDQVTASYKDGILNVTLPRAEASKPRKIQIEAA